MITIVRKENCCGCNACGDICPNNAITYTVDEEGFWYPSVNKDLCCNCGLCDKTCPSTFKYINPSNIENPQCYVAEHKSIEVVFSSTTGGVFSALADVMYAQNGYVGGAIHNEDFSVSHFISNDKSDLKKLRRSKDLQSNSEGFYNEVKRLLLDNQKVLVCGVPCQIAALKKFLGQDYEDLITVELICAGVNSPMVWSKYLEYIERINGSKIVDTENKSKEYGWSNLTQKFVLENGEEYFDTKETSLFIKGYVGSHLYCRPSCYECKYKGFPRVADITIGDYWGISNYKKEYNSDMGTNVVFVNSEKGKAFFEKTKKRIRYEETPIEWALRGNPALVNSITKMNDRRKEFFEDIANASFEEVVNKYHVTSNGFAIRAWRKVKPVLRFLRTVVKTTRLHPVAVYQTIKYSRLCNLVHLRGIICGTNCHISIAKTAKLDIQGLLVLGKKEKFPHSKAESRLFIGDNASLRVLGPFDVDSNCEIIVFANAELVIHGAKHGISDANEGLRVVCGESIEIQSDVGIGRDVTIRDTNGNHYMNTTGYRPTRRVVIGEKAWLCEACTIMPGVKIGRSAIVGINSTVTKSVPSHALVSGAPAEVVQENVLWKL